MWRDRDFYPPRSRPRKVAGGIKAQSKRGQFGQSWWAKRWIAVLESFNIGARLGRGRSYARGGQVLSVEVGRGEVTARVQGSRPKPYEVSIEVNVLSQADWNKLVKALAGQALYSAKLLAGEMPQDIEKVFEEAGLSLFPQKRKDLKTSCSCPDSSNPCKHIAAVYYLLGEEFDRDPFLIFQLRGLSKDELSARLGAVAKSTEAAPAVEAAPAETKEPLPTDAKTFWSGGALPPDLFEDVSRQGEVAAWPKRLGNFPFWRAGENFLDAMQTVYKTARQQGLALFLGEQRKE